MNVFFDNTRSALSPHSGVGHVGLDLFLALKRHGKTATPHFGIRRDADVPAANLALLRARGCTPLRRFDPRLSVLLPLRTKILHSTYHKLPSLRFRTRIVHVHDVWTLRPNPYQSQEFQQRRAARFRRLVAQTDLFSVMTQTVKDDFVFELGVDPSRVAVVGYGCPRDLEDPAPAESSEPVVPPGDPFVLCLARVEVRKNHEHTARAVQAVPGLRLVVVGGSGYGAERVEEECFEPLRREGRLVRLRSVEPEALVWLYRHALAFLLPSWEEGFGIPLLEAMRFGLPVITSNASGNREVVGPGGELVDPKRWEESAHWLERLRDEGALREALRQRSLARASEFRWEDVARRLEALYASAG